jgi:hypothetical protein
LQEPGYYPSSKFKSFLLFQIHPRDFKQKWKQKRKLIRSTNPQGK